MKCIQDLTKIDIDDISFSFTYIAEHILFYVMRKFGFETDGRIFLMTIFGYVWVRSGKKSCTCEMYTEFDKN